MRRIILDTDVASQVIKQRVPAPLARQLAEAEHGITFVTYGELTRWSITRQWGPARRSSLDAWLAARPTLPYTDDVSRIWGEITAYAARRGRPRPQNDSWIAATCLAYGLPLATLNVKDFSDFAEHEGLVLMGV
ncbi:type II toxin-antitoxin system VapC family toxin [Pseudonocardia pini]|uniref:type II toxin-antitoxin system VapC family toxin n=1 Tax=Pseudonocardia pini TaxID=2758030 RepID=UPI0015F10BEE|nr:type II toxin-antitoxin system VapC family toxin [Pseudonocardia pini]